MKAKTVLCLLGMAALVAGFASTTAVAEQNAPASVLIYPYVDSSSSSPTIISISSTYLKGAWKRDLKEILPAGNEVCEPGPPERRYGETAVHFKFFDGTDCLESDFNIFLTPLDHVTFLASDKIPDGRVGWMVAFACDPDFPEGAPIPWNFDFLVGQAHVVDSAFNLSWTYNPYAFLSSKWNAPFIGAGDVGPHCGKHYIDKDIGDDDGILDFDNIEYEQFPDQLLLPRFFEEADDGDDYDSLLALISPNNSQFAQRAYKNTYSVLFWNNDENEHGFPFSKARNFVCMDVTSLRGVTVQFMDLGGILEEEPTGWAIFDGYAYRDEPVDAPILGVFAQFNKILGGDPAKHAGGNNFFTRGFNAEKAEIQYDFGR